MISLVGVLAEHFFCCCVIFLLHTIVGTYTVYESGKPFFHARVTQSSSNKPPVKDQQLFDIRRPTYMNDLRIQNSSTLDRYFSVDMSLRGADSCSYQMGFGMNCLNETVRSEENSTFSQYDYDCTYVKWAGSLGFYPFDYTLSNRFITFVGALNQWEIFGDSTAFQTFTMRSNHFQIISMGYNVTENEWFQVGQYRDTLPMVTDSVVIRFTSADYAGEHTMQTNFIRHKELGVKESYLVVNYSTFQALTEFPTQAPTGTPNGTTLALLHLCHKFMSWVFVADGIIQTLSFQMAVAFGIVIILGGSVSCVCFLCLSVMEVIFSLFCCSVCDSHIFDLFHREPQHCVSRQGYIAVVSFPSSQPVFLFDATTSYSVPLCLQNPGCCAALGKCT